MIRSPWFRASLPGPDTSCTVVAGQLQFSSWRGGLRSLLWTARVHHRLGSCPGLLGHSLAVDLRRRVLCTVSAWSSRSAVVAFERSEWHHGAARREISPRLTSSTFAVWDSESALLPLTWVEIDRRLGEASRRAGGSSAR